MKISIRYRVQTADLPFWRIMEPLISFLLSCNPEGTTVAKPFAVAASINCFRCTLLHVESQKSCLYHTSYELLVIIDF